MLIKRAIQVILLLLLIAVVYALMARGQDTDTIKLATLEQRLSQLEGQIALLEDSKAIKRLQRAYGYYVDKGLSHEVAGLFAEQATVEIGGYGVYAGKDHVASFYRRLLGDRLQNGHLNNHLIMQGVVHVAPDGRTAKGRWRALIQQGEYGKSAVWSEGPYENEYVKDNGVWKFSKVHWYMTFAAPYDPGWHKAPQPMPGPYADLPPDRPPSVDYQAYPAAYLPPYHYPNPVTGRETGVPQ